MMSLQERDLNKRAHALESIDRAIGTLLDLTVEDQCVARTLKICAAKLREIQQENMPVKAAG